MEIYNKVRGIEPVEDLEIESAIEEKSDIETEKKLLEYEISEKPENDIEISKTSDDTTMKQAEDTSSQEDISANAINETKEVNEEQVLQSPKDEKQETSSKPELID